MTEIPELTEEQMKRAIPVRLRKRLIEGRFGQTPANHPREPPLGGLNQGRGAQAGGSDSPFSMGSWY